MKNLKTKKDIIFTDNVNYLNKINIEYSNKTVISFSLEKKYNEKIKNFYDFINTRKRLKLAKERVKILKYFNTNLKINNAPALKNNLCKIFYGCIGIFPIFDTITNITKKQKKVQLFTREKNIYDIFKYFENKKTQLNFKNNNISFEYNLSRIGLLKLLTTNEIRFHLERKYNKNFSNLNNLSGNHFIFVTIDPNYCEIKNNLDKTFKKKIIVRKKFHFKKRDFNKNIYLNSIVNICKDVTKKYFKNNLFFKNYLIKQMVTFYYDYENNFKYYSKKFKNFDSKVFFLTKTIRNPINTSIYDIGKKFKKKFYWITSQHGHGIEMTKLHRCSSLTKEETLSDLFLVYSKKGKMERYKNIYIKKNIKISEVGFNRNLTPAINIPKHDVLYLSNLNQELSVHEINMSNYNNSKKLLIEKNLINNVFAKVNKSILFKDYPGEKYTNIKYDLISNIINNHKNIKYFYKRLNAENIIPKSSIIITSLATSTIGPCIQSKKPLIFIDFRSILPVDKKLIDKFKKYFFYFKYDKQFFNRLKNFLNKDYNTIKNMWEKKNTRLKDVFIDEYFNIKEKKVVLKNITNLINKFSNK